jgi:cysteine desulfurase/selenocysteine lyase
VPAGALDVGTLTRLANEFFAALPDALPQSVAGVVPAKPAEPSTVLAPIQTAATAAGAPPAPSTQPVAGQAAALTHGAAGVPYDVPSAYAPALPDVGLLHALPSAGPAPGAFYFLQPPEALPPAGELQPATALRDDRVTPHDAALPGSGDLARLLEGLAVPSRFSEAAPTPRSAPTFYFLESALPTQLADRGTPVSLAHPLFDVATVRRDFPILAERVNGKPLIWLDNAATTQKPQSVIDRLAYFYAHENSNIHRAAHELAARATDAYENARKTVADFLGAGSADEIIFVRGATEGVNLVAQSWGRQNILEGDEIVLSQLEHHANIVPWQQLAAEKKARIRVIPVDDRGELLLDEFQKLLNSRTKLVAVTQVSNALGTITPVREIAERAHRTGATVLIDGAQAVSHMRVDVQAIGADFYVFSGHKLFGPTGIGAVYGKRELLEAMPPWQGGGNMIADVTFDKTSYQPPPAKFEAGTGNIADAAGLAAAIDYVERLGLENIARYEHDLLVYATESLRTVPGLRLIGTAPDKASVLSFVLEGYRTEEVGEALSQEGIAVRAGHHCAQPILRRFGLEATVRPSLAFYNTCEEIDALTRVVLRLARATRSGGRSSAP